MVFFLSPNDIPVLNLCDPKIFAAGLFFQMGHPKVSWIARNQLEGSPTLVIKHGWEIPKLNKRFHRSLPSGNLRVCDIEYAQSK